MSESLVVVKLDMHPERYLYTEAIRLWYENEVICVYYEKRVEQIGQRIVNQDQYLTACERESLESPALRQRAKAIEAFLKVTSLVSMPTEKIEHGLETIRSLDKQTAKRMRHELGVVAMTLDRLGLEESGHASLSEPAEVEESGDGLAHSEADQSEVVVEVLSEDTEVIQALPAQLTPEVEVLELLRREEPQQDIIADRVQWLLRAATIDIQETDSIENIARVIYKMAGEPAMRKNQSGIVPDPIERIIQRLDGLTSQEIAEKAMSTEGSMNQWFGSLTRKIRESMNGDIGAAFRKLLNEANGHSSGELPQSIQPEEVIETLEESLSMTTPSIEEANNTPDEAALRNDMLQGNYNGAHIARSFMRLMPDTDNEDLSMLFEERSDAEFQPDRALAAAKHIRTLLPRDIADLGVAGDEKVELRKALGVYTQSSLPVQRPPIIVSQPGVNHHMRAVGFAKTLNYLEKRDLSSAPTPRMLAEALDHRRVVRQAIGTDNEYAPETWRQAAEQCIAEGLGKHDFAPQEIEIIWQRFHFGENDEHSFVQKDTKAALDKLQRLLNEKYKQNPSERNVQRNMLAMAVATFDGVRSLDDVYHRVVEKYDPTITKTQVERGIVGELSRVLYE